jgi:hypothetical protein
MKRETLADDGTLTVEHHADEPVHTRRLQVYSVAAQLTGHDEGNKDIYYRLGYPTGHERLAQSFQISATSEIRQAWVHLQKVGSLSGKTLTLRIETDSAGDPSGTLADANATQTLDADTITTGGFEMYKLIFPDVFSLTGSTTYWIVLTQDWGPDVDNYLEWGAEGYGGAGTYADGQGKTYNTGDGWMDADSRTNGVDDFCFSFPTDRLDPCVIGRWASGTRDVAARYDDGSNADENTKTTAKNVTGGDLDTLIAVEVQ